MSETTAEERIAAALDVAMQWGGTDGAHHKMWVIDQMVRSLTGCPTETRQGIDVRGNAYNYEALGESDVYRVWVGHRRDGDDGPETYDWDAGIAP